MKSKVKQRANGEIHVRKNYKIKTGSNDGKKINLAIQPALEEKGNKFIANENVNPDFVVVTHAGVKDRMSIHNTGYSRGWNDPWWGPYGGHTNVSHYESKIRKIEFQ